MSFVLDNSVALSWCFEDEQTPALMALLDRVADEGGIAPVLWPLEAVNGLIAAERRGRLDAGKRQELSDFLRRLPVTLDTGSGERAWADTAVLAVRHRLSAYDAAYLELALRRKLPLATLDRDLRRAATVLGVELLGLVD